MRKIWFFCFCLLMLSCDDGDLQIEEVDFEASTIEFCDIDTTIEDELDITLLFKIQDDEALILTLEEGLLENETSEINSITSEIPGESQLTYRFFSDAITSSYFCDDIPPSTPTVLEEIDATGGTLIINTFVSVASETTKTYRHDIQFQQVSLTNSLGERLTDTAGFNYGNVSSTTDNSPELLFANYSDIAVTACETNFVENQVRLYKLNSDELIFIDLPESLFLNEVTASPREIDLATLGSFNNYIFDTLVDASFVCTTANLDDDSIVGEYVSTSGTVSVTTVENPADEEDFVTYTHTITVNNLNLTLLALDEDDDDENLEEIETFVFGTYTTPAN